MSTLTTDLLPARRPRSPPRSASSPSLPSSSRWPSAPPSAVPPGAAPTYSSPTGLRVASAFAFVFWALAALIILGRAGIQPSPLPTALLRWGTRILIGVLALGAGLNFASPSDWERYLWGPAALILAGLCLLVARSGATPSGG
jgi:hypothetical protein